MPAVSVANAATKVRNTLTSRRVTGRKSANQAGHSVAPGTPAATQTSNPAVTVPTRRISFDAYFEGMPKHFAGDQDLILSHFGAALSAVFPDGEDFFVRSVRHYRDRITDPILRKQVAGFIGQESVHGREHRAFNNHLAALGYPTKRMEVMAKYALAAREKVMSAESNLAATAAMEHFTATLAELVLRNESIRQHLGPGAGRDLFVWHALEESEHKAVAFDVYKAIGGSERVRVLTMKIIRIGLILAIGSHLFGSVLGDRDTYRPGVLRASWKRFKASPMFTREVWDQLCDYDRPDFHPDDSDTTELVAKWREELFGNAGSLVDHLATTTKG